MKAGIVIGICWLVMGMYACMYVQLASSHQAGALAVDIICERANRITGML